jgi:hypothetical protein
MIKRGLEAAIPVAMKLALVLPTTPRQLAVCLDPVYEKLPERIYKELPDRLSGN